MTRARLAVAALALVATGCTPAQHAAWRAWHAVDPVAATEFAHDLAEQEPAPQAIVSSRYGSSMWDRIARCESGSQWGHRPVTNRTGTYSGGLMIGHRWWPLYGGREFAAYPYLATKAEQITVAERIADDVGLDAGWQCWG
jgi:hypothetical protein